MSDSAEKQPCKAAPPGPCWAIIQHQLHHCSEMACGYGRGMVDPSAEQPLDSSARLCLRSPAEVLVPSSPVGWALQEMVTQLYSVGCFSGSRGLLCAMLWDVWQSSKLRKHFFLNPLKWLRGPVLECGITWPFWCQLQSSTQLLGGLYVHLLRLLTLPSGSRFPPPSKKNTRLKGSSGGKPVLGSGQRSKLEPIRSSADFGGAGSAQTQHGTAGCYFLSWKLSSRHLIFG